MNEDTLGRALGALRTARMPEATSDRVREQLEAAWRERATPAQRRRAFAVPALAIAALVVAIGFGTLHAGADSPLYAARVAIEDALVAVQADPIAYVSALYDERLEEAARFEAAGNALAASRARDATDDALRLLNQIAPKQDQPEPSPSASTNISLPSPSPTPDATVAPTQPATPTPTSRAPGPTSRPTVAPPKTPTPTPKPVVTPTPAPMVVHATGDVLYVDGSPVDGACVSTSFDGMCIAGTLNGKVDVQLLASKGQTITLYFRNYDPARGGTLRGKVSVTVGGPTVLLGTITLRPG